MDLNEAQWAVLRPLIPEPPRRADGRVRFEDGEEVDAPRAAIRLARDPI